MANGMKKTLSVRDMGKMLGLKKGESYYLVHKGCFKTILVEGKIRVVTDSFEEWYENQLHFRKVEGEPPGKKLRQTSWSVKEAAELLGISMDIMYAVLHRDQVPTFMAEGVIRIPKDSFYQWYRNQDRYRTDEDKEKDAELEAASMTLPEMARLLDIPRAVVYKIIREDRGRTFKIIMLGGRKRILRESFEKWYAGQSTYKKPEDREVGESYRPGKRTYISCLKGKNPEEFLKTMSMQAITEAEPETQTGSSEETKTYLTVMEAAGFLGCSPSTVRRWIGSGKIKEERLISGRVRIDRSQLEGFLASGSPEDETGSTESLNTDERRSESWRPL